jgi:hypothetical protein
MWSAVFSNTKAKGRQITMKQLILAVFTASMLLAASVGHAAKCNFEKGLPVTTEWDGITNDMMNPTARGAVAAVFDGDRQRVLLGVQVKTSEYYRPPEWYGSDLKKKSMVKEHEAYLQNEGIVIPAESELRITFVDRTTITLMTTQELRANGQVTKPNNKFEEKGFGGFLKSAVAAEMGGSSETNPNYRVDGTLNIFYELAPDELDLLTRSPIMNIRVEARDNYYYLGTRDTDHNLAVSEKASLKVQNALNCVLNKK